MKKEREGRKAVRSSRGSEGGERKTEREEGGCEEEGRGTVKTKEK